MSEEFVVQSIEDLESEILQSEEGTKFLNRRWFYRMMDTIQD